MAEEETISSKYVYTGRVVSLRLDTVCEPDGKEGTREIIEHAACIVVVAVDEKDNILLVRQYRKPVRRELLELPAGGIDPGENVEAAVYREMQEETGFVPRRLVRLGGFFSTPGFCTEYLHLFLATELAPSRLFAEDTEGISLIRVPVKEIPAMLRSGKFEDAKSIAGLYMYMEYLARNPVR